MTSPKERGRKTPELRVTAELNALTSAGLSHLTAELGNPSSPTLMEFLVFYFQHRGKPLLRGLWSCPDRFSFSLNVLVPSGTALLSQAAALYLRSESFQGWFAFRCVKLALSSQTDLAMLLCRPRK